MGQLLDKYSFFDGLEMEPVTQVTWSNYWKGIIPDGVVAEIGEEMRPYANSTGMYVYVSPGACVVDNHRGVNSVLKTLAVNTADTIYDRIDLLVARVVYGNENESYMELDILTGTPAIDPVAPELTQSTGDVYEIALAEVYVAANAVTLEASTVADMRNVFTAASQSISFINDDEVALTKGMLVWLSRDNEGAVKRCPAEKMPIGVVTSDSIPVGSRGQVATVSGTIEEIACTEGTVILGDALIPSETAGIAKVGAGYAGGLALEGKESGAVGNVKALLGFMSKLPIQNAWYLPEGITEDMVIAAWQFVNRPTEAQALININAGNEYALAKIGSGVTWNTESGFTIGNDYTNGLNNADVNTLYASVLSAAFGYSGLSLADGSQRTGGITMNSKRTLTLRGYTSDKNYTGTLTINKNANTELAMRASDKIESAVVSCNWMSASEIYRDGAMLSLTAASGSGSVLGTYSKTFGQIGVTTGYERGFVITAAVLYNVTLSATQHLELANNIRALGGIS